MDTNKNVGMNIPLGKPIFDKEMEDAALNALRNERFVLGESVSKFEEEFAKFCGVDYAIATSSGTNALQIAMIALGVTKDDSVITTPASFIATSNAIIHANSNPVFSDIDLSTYNLDPKQLKKSITPKTKAVLPVHLYGYPADIDPIIKAASKQKAFVIEDCCQAHGASYNGKRIGSLGDVGCFSFYPSKNMTVGGDGGMITTSNKTLAESCKKLRDCGRKSQYVHDIIGFTSRLNSVNAAIGRVQLKHIIEWDAQRRKVAQQYDSLLGDIEGLVLPPKPTDEIKPVYHCYVLRTKKRDELKTWLESKGIACGIHYALPIHLQPIYQQMYGYKEGAYPNAEELCNTCLSIPIYPSLTRAEIHYITEQVHGFFEKKED